VEGESCDTELALDVPSTPQPAAGAEGVKMFTTPMQHLQVDNTHLPISRQENEDSLKNLGELLMDRMSSFLSGYADHQEPKTIAWKGQQEQKEIAWNANQKQTVELLIALQDKFDERIDERVETGLTKVREGLTVRLNTAQQETGKQIDDLAGQASALSKRLDNDQAERIRKTKETNLEQEHKVSRQLETVADGMDSRFQKVEKTQRVNAQAVSTKAKT